MAVPRGCVCPTVRGVGEDGGRASASAFFDTGELVPWGTFGVGGGCGQAQAGKSPDPQYPDAPPPHQ